MLAIHTTALLAAHDGEVLSNRDMAAFLGASEAHLSKVLQRLGRSGIVASVRGPRGGFMLDKPAEEITLMEVYEAIDGPLAESECLLDEPVCQGNCILGDLLAEVCRMVRHRLSGTRVSNIAASMEGKLRHEEKDNIH